jgi:hypothetical protein
MNAAGYVVVFIGGVAVGAWALRAKESSCCERVSYGARDKIAGYAGPFSGLVKEFLDASGLTKLLPGTLDAVGVPKDA